MMVVNTLIRIDGKAEEYVESRVSNKDLEVRLLEDKAKGVVRGEQWFRDATLWYELVVSYNNPYNHRKVHSELYLLHDNKSTLANLLQDSTLIIYGVGVGETEIELVDWQLERTKYIEVVGIDVNEKFIRKFIGGLRNKKRENHDYKIMFRGYHSLFEQIQPSDIVFDNSRYSRRTHICLGNTIGNYPRQQEIFDLFASNSQSEDLLLLGFQLDTDIDILFEKYSNNPEFARFILNWLEYPDFSRLTWEIDRSNSTIKARYGGLEVFRSKKYNSDRLVEFVSKFGYVLQKLVVDNDKNSCVQFYKKT